MDPEWADVFPIKRGDTPASYVVVYLPDGFFYCKHVKWKKKEPTPTIGLKQLGPGNFFLGGFFYSNNLFQSPGLTKSVFVFWMWY